jgi:hypothetical protein
MNHLEPDNQNLEARAAAYLRPPTLPPGFRARLEQRIEGEALNVGWGRWMILIERLEALAVAAIAAAIWFALPIFGRLIAALRFS